MRLSLEPGSTLQTSLAACDGHNPSPAALRAQGPSSPHSLPRKGWRTEPHEPGRVGDVSFPVPSGGVLSGQVCISDPSLQSPGLPFYSPRGFLLADDWSFRKRAGASLLQLFRGAGFCAPEVPKPSSIMSQPVRSPKHTTMPRVAWVQVPMLWKGQLRLQQAAFCLPVSRASGPLPGAALVSSPGPGLQHQDRCLGAPSRHRGVTWV